MKTYHILVTAIMVLMSIGQTLMPQSFRTVTNGNLSNPDTWEQSNNDVWEPATSFPGQTSTDAVLTIQESNHVYINPGTDIIIKDINVEATGKLTVHTGGKISIADQLKLAGNAGAAIVVNNEQSTGIIVTLNCGGSTLNGTLTEGEAASNVIADVPYTGRNGENHFGQTVKSTGVTGLIAVLDSGTFVDGNATLTYTITGTPTEAGDAAIALEVGRENCDLFACSLYSMVIFASPVGQPALPRQFGPIL